MDLSIPLSGIQTADAALNSTARSVTLASLGAGQRNQTDSVDLSTAAIGLLTAKLSFMANVKVASVEADLTQNEISLLA